METNPPARKKNPNSSLRNGFSYEDLVVLSYCLNWLNYSMELDWIETQYSPENKILPGLDDVVIQKKNGEQCFIQVKHVQNPNNEKWVFKNLLDKGLKKWISSTIQLNENQSAQLFTNAIPDIEISNILVNNHLSIDNLKRCNPQIYQELCLNFSEDSLKKFSNKFKFLFENPGVNELEEKLLSLFWEDLRLPFNSTIHLINFIEKNGRKSEPVRLIHDDIKKHLDWKLPRHLNQNFKIPSDFQLFNSDIHKNLVKELSGKSGGIKIISGKPGTGKSTYLSKLHSQITKRKNTGTIILRHHYHLNPEDDSSQERLLSYRALEGLKAQFINLPEWALGHLKNQNFREVQTGDYIKTISANCSSKKGTFILIVDGLDHVIREGKEAIELQQFLNQVYFPQQGYWLVLGTQPFIYKELPSAIKRASPKNEWIEIGSLSFEAVLAIASKNFPKKKNTMHEHRFQNIGRKLFRKSQGNALYLKYIINEIRIKDKVGFLDWDLIPSYSGNISNYYQGIWDGFTSLSKSIVFVLASIEFRLTYSQFESLIKVLAKNPEDLATAFLQVEHLLNPDIDGVSVWHNSFLVYLKARPEYEIEKNSLVRKVCDWLQSSRDTSLKLLKSFEIPRLKNFVGDPDDLLALSYNWATERYLEGADQYQISSIFNEASSQAFELDRFGDFVRLKNIEIRVENSINDLNEHLEGIRTLSLQMRDFQVDSVPRFGRLETYDLKLFITGLKRTGKIKSFPQKAIDAFNLHLTSGHNYDDRAALNLVQASAVFEDFGLDRIKGFIERDRAEKVKLKFYSAYFNEAIKAGKIQNAFELANHSNTQIAWTALVEQLVLFQLLTNQNNFKAEIEDIKEKSGPNILTDLFTLFEGGIITSGPIPIEYIPSSLLFADPTSTKFSKSLLYNFIQLFIYQVTDKEKEILTYVDTLHNSFPDSLTLVLLDIASIFSERYRDGSSINPVIWLSKFEELPELLFGEGRDLYEFRRTVIPGLLSLLFEFNVWVNLKLKEPLLISVKDVEALLESSWIDRPGMYSILESKLLTDQAFVHLENVIKEDLEDSKVNIPDRCKLFLCLANLAFGNGKNELASEYLFKSARFIIAHGYHKDLFFGELLATLKKMLLRGSMPCEKYINQIAPYVVNIGWLTDGDETRSYIHELIKIIGLNDKKKLFPFYLEMFSRRDSNASDSIFSSIIETADLSDPVQLCLAKTALEPSALAVLKVRANSDIKAFEALETIYSALGPIDYSRISQSNESFNSEKKPTDIDYGKIYPSEFDSFVQKNWIDTDLNRYEISNRIVEWVKYWSAISVKHLSLLKAIKTLKAFPLENLTEETWELIFPIASKYDSEFAFECLIWGQAASNDWSFYWTNNPEKYKRRWKPLFQFFPERATEFFRESIKRSSLKRGSSCCYFLPLDKGVDFFLDACIPEIAKNIFEVNLEIIPDLFPEIILKYSPAPIQVGPFEILLSRVQSISPLVRERAAHETAQILSQDASGEFATQFCKWLQNQPLETQVCDGLLIALKSLQLENSLIHNHFKTIDLKFNLKGTNILINLLCNEIRVLLGENELEFVNEVFTIPRPSEKHSKLFASRLRGHLTPRFSNQLRDFGSFIPIDPFYLLKGVFEEKCFSLGFDWVNDEDNNYTHAQDFMNCHQNFIGEILKSSYLKVLDFLHFNFGMPYEVGRFWSIEVLSIDVSLWSVRPSQCPKDWPVVQGTLKKSGKKDQLFMDDLFTQVNSLVLGDNENYVLHSEGSIVSNSQKEDSSVEVLLSLYSFGYRVNGKDFPSNEELFYFVQNSSHNLVPLSNGTSPWLFPIGSGPEFKTVGELSNEVHDLEIFPLIGFARIGPISYWRFPTKIYPMAFPSQIPFEDLQIIKTEGSIEFLDRLGGHVGKLNNFNLGLPYFNSYNGPIRAGTILSLKRKYVDKMLFENKLRLGHVFKLEFHTRENSYSQETKLTDFYSTINLSQIIV